MLDKKKIAIVDRTIRIIVLDDISPKGIVNNQILSILDEMKKHSDASQTITYDQPTSYGCDHTDISQVVYVEDALLDVSRDLLLETPFLSPLEKMIYAMMSVSANYFVIKTSQTVFLSKIKEFLCDNDIVDYDSFFVCYMSSKESYDLRNSSFVSTYVSTNLDIAVYLYGDMTGFQLYYLRDIDPMMMNKKIFKKQEMEIPIDHVKYSSSISVKIAEYDDEMPNLFKTLS